MPACLFVSSKSVCCMRCRRPHVTFLHLSPSAAGLAGPAQSKSPTACIMQGNKRHNWNRLLNTGSPPLPPPPPIPHSSQDGTEPDGIRTL